MKYCSKCGWEMQDDEVFCRNCGTQSVSSQEPKMYNTPYVDDTPPKTVNKTKRIIITILLAIAIVGILSNAFDCFELASTLSEDGEGTLRQLLEDNPYLEMNFNDIPLDQMTSTEIAQFAEILRIIMIVIGVCCLIPLCWTIPMSIKIFKAMKEGTVLKTGFKICTLIFVNLITGIVLLCSSDI